ncbi:hypothetical protein HWV07_04945 [Natronomonas salina]|uniref:DUF7546 family protein n=1 Tax=Natronomonas salina TaxID=1710540 RepID=UPI0015B3B599|nr:hypothetical protein [Natronomonas salina]QLD88412.1 hypothetical protein HWV07_04945 [Natronomonas salina]
MFDRATRRVDALGDGDRRTLLYTAVVANTLVLLVLAYAIYSGRPVTSLWAYPVVWITVGAWALLRTSPAPTDARTRRVAAVVAVGYYLLLGFVGGLFGPSQGIATGLTVQVTDLPPGWNPAVLYGGETVQFAFIPYMAFGYAVLSYLVYATAIEAKSAVAGGLLGLFSCVSCTLPVVASVLGGFVGGAGALTAAASSLTYGAGTVVFVVTVLLLSYRPGFGLLQRDGR